MIRYVYINLILFFMFILFGCGGGGGGSSDSSSISNNSTSANEAVLLDSAVYKAKYDKGDGVIRYTDRDGIFEYIEGKEVKFWVGNIYLGKAKPIDKPANVNAVRDKIVTPFELCGVVNKSLNNQRVLKLAKFLMSVDKDNKATNGIEVDLGRLKDSEKNGDIFSSSLDKILKKRTFFKDEEVQKHLRESLNLDLEVAIPYTKQVDINSTLINAPEGMSINPKTGLITWTPTPNQVGDVRFEVKSGHHIETISLKVKEGDFNNSNIVFISPNGNNDNNGSYEAPLQNTKKLCSNTDILHPNLTIYFRGGVYHNPNYGSGDKNNPSIPQIKCSGKKGKRVTIKPWGNERVLIEYDSATALRLTGHYVDIEGFEIKGVGDKISYKEAVSNWWRGDNYYNGNGIAVNGHHIEIRDNILGYIPVQAIAVKRADYVTIKNNIVYNSAWWSVGGTNAMSINDSIAVDDANVTHHKIEGNLIFGVESRIYSRVWKKNRAHLTIDEGGAILVQVNDGNYTGRYLVENNIALFTGKGIISNKTPNVDMLHNTIYGSGTTMTGKYRGLRGNKAHNSTFKYNAVTIFNNEGMTLSLSDDTTGVKSEKNCAIRGDQDKFTNGFTYVDKVYTNPTALDFSIDGSNGCDKSVGASSDTLKLMLNRAKANGIEVKATNYVVDYPQQTKDVIAAIPEGANVDFSNWSDSEEFDINVTNIPSGVKGRPSSFVLEVVHPYKRENIAKKYGIATQGTESSYYYYEPAKNAIDGNLSTFNHTSNNSNKNWLQIELPKKTKVDKIVITGRQDVDWMKNRWNGTKVYALSEPYDGNLSGKTPIATLEATMDAQIFTYNIPIEANYILLKDRDNNFLHMAEVEVYGMIYNAPLAVTYDKEVLVAANTQVGDVIATIEAVDYQGDKIIYSLSDDRFNIDNNGNIAFTEAIASGEYPLTVTLSDGIYSSSIAVKIVVTEANVLERVLKSGDISNVLISQKELLQSARDELSFVVKQADTTLLEDIYGDDSIVFDPGNRVQFINIAGDRREMFPILFGNKGHNFASAGYKLGSRFAAFGFTPMYYFNHNQNMTYETKFKRLLSWLIEGDAKANIDNKTVALSFLGSGDKNEIKSWIEKHYPNWSLKECSRDASNMPSCYEGVDLIMTGWRSDNKNAKKIKEALKQKLQSGVPVLYMHTWYEATNQVSQAIGSLLEFTLPNGGNYWAKDKIEWDDLAQMQKRIYKDINTTLEHLIESDYLFDWSKCKHNGSYNENGDDCSEIQGVLDSEFLNGARFVRDILTVTDRSKISVFDGNTTHYRLHKLFVLIGDKLREDVVMPMDKVKSDDNTFMRSLFADHAVFSYRSIAPAHPDMGNFSRSNFNHITPIIKTVTLTSKKPFRSTGAYALPGERFRVTRDDDANVTVQVFINTVRAGSTHEYEKDGYKRPKYLQSVWFKIEPHETIELTSVYGGPIELAFDKNDINVTIRFENVGEHPYWSEFNTNTNKDTEFSDALDADEYDWAEIVTSSFEVHSTREKMLMSINNFRWGSASKLAEATKLYASSYPMSLAGFKGPGIEVIDEVKRFADDNNITIYNADFVKHMNADQPVAGSGSSGNPYDASWEFDPISHGDIHEIGHSLEKDKFRLAGWELHSSTNYYAYYTQMKYNQYVQQDDTITDKERYYFKTVHVPVSVFKDVFNKINQAVNEDDPKQYLQYNLWANSNYRSQSLFMIQAMMVAQKYASGDYNLTNGFHLFSRLHILERYLAKDAKKDWEENKAKIGFDTYSYSEIRSINSNDWLVVSLSFATGLDYRPFFDMYGEPYSQKASDQVASFNFPKVKKVFFAQKSNSGFILPDDGSGAYLDKTEVSVDGNSNYPY